MAKVRVRQYQIPIAGLSDDLRGYRIVQLTDLHAGRRNHGCGAMEVAKAWSADLVVVTGDMIHDEGGAGVARDFFRQLVTLLEPRDGFLGVLGNHDQKLLRSIDANLPIRWLNNETIGIACGSGKLNVMGLDQRAWCANDVCTALAGLDEGQTTVVLGHYPATAMLVADLADLVLVGHTHGGQIKLPGLPFFTNDYLGWRYGYGLRRLGRAYVVICAGLGYSGPVSVRVFSPPEIVVVDLVTA